MTRPQHRRTAHFVGLALFDRLEGFTDLEARIAALPTEQDRGDAFEVFAEAYLVTQKLVGAEEVWAPVDQVPIGDAPLRPLPHRHDVVAAISPDVTRVTRRDYSTIRGQ